MQIIRTTTSVISKEEQTDLVQINFLPDTEMYAENVIEDVNALKYITNGNKTGILFDARNIIYYDVDVCNLYALQNHSFAGPVAIVSNTIGSRLMIDHFRKKQSADHPISIFSDPLKAKNWLINISTMARTANDQNSE